MCPWTGGWVRLSDVAPCLGEEAGLIFHAGMSLGTDPVQIAVAAYARQGGAFVDTAESETRTMIKALEDYGCVLKDHLPPVSLLIHAAHGHSLPHVLTERIRKRCPADWFGTDTELQIPVFLEALTGIAVVGLIPGGRVEPETHSLRSRPGRGHTRGTSYRRGCSSRRSRSPRRGSASYWLGRTRGTRCSVGLES